MHNEVVEDPSPPSIVFEERTLKGALQTGGIDGFGPWEITISDSATKDLRELRRGDKSKAAIVVKRIQYVMLDMMKSALSELTQTAFKGPLLW